MALSLPFQRPSHPRGLSLRTFNIFDGRIFRLAQAIRMARIGSFNLMILTNTKITYQA